MSQPDYQIHTDIKFAHGQRIDVDAEVSACTDPWFNQTLTKVNDAVVRLGILDGEFHWHQHPDEDEFFFVLSGQLLVDVGSEDDFETIELGPNQGVTITKSVMHRPRAPVKTVVLMVEDASIKPTGS